MHRFTYYKVVSQEKALVTGACNLTFAEKLFQYISVDIGMRNNVLFTAKSSSMFTTSAHISSDIGI